MPCRILMSNLGYARHIGGTLSEHVMGAHRHFYCSPAVQQKALRQLSAIISEADPDICCFVEIDKGSFTSGGFNQLESLLTEKYSHFDIENKYAPGSRLRSFFMTSGKSNAFIARHRLPYHKLYFKTGVKRLIYKIQIDGLTLYFAHFALGRAVRRQQIVEARAMMDETPGEAMFLGDFNILDGIGELDPLLKNSRYLLLNRAEEPTFRLHRRHLVLDLCICSRGIAARTELKVVPQPYSDHAALLLDIRTG